MDLTLPSSVVQEQYSVSSITVTGDILDCEDKIDNGDIVNAVCVMHDDWSYTPSSANTNKAYILMPLSQWIGGYRNISFGAVYYPDTDDSLPIAVRVTFQYDASDGSLLHGYWTVGGTSN